MHFGGSGKGGCDASVFDFAQGRLFATEVLRMTDLIYFSEPFQKSFTSIPCRS
jgi:hypothetical protein